MNLLIINKYLSRNNNINIIEFLGSRIAQVILIIKSFFKLFLDISVTLYKKSRINIKLAEFCLVFHHIDVFNFMTFQCFLCMQRFRNIENTSEKRDINCISQEIQKLS